MRDRVRMRRWHVGWSTGLALLGLVLVAFTVAARAYDAPPARAARLSYLQGSVTVVRTDNTGSDSAQLNMPLAEGLRVTTGDDGQAEIEFEDGSLVRLTPNSSLSLDSLRADASGNFQTQLALVQGLVYAELRASSKYVYRLSAGEVVVSPVENAVIRINLDKPPGAISVLSGTAHVEHPGSADAGGYRTDVRAGETLSGDSTDPGRYFLTQQTPEESWDAWNEEREQAAADESASQTAARDNYAGDHGYGWSDLDANGSWYDVPDQGRVWQPTVAADADFDPYGYGSWVWYPSAGYVWASGYGWGWTPYRCGNWSFWSGFGWGWIPGGNCGFGGWGFGRGGYGFNIVRPPQNYHFRPLPVRSPGGVHPIVVVHPGRGPNRPLHPLQGPRTIAGHTLEPLRPIGNSYTPRGGSAVGSSLRRDFPVDRTSHQPVMGNVVTPGGWGAGAPASRSGADWRSGVPRPGNGVGAGTPASPGQPIHPPIPGGQRIDGMQGVHPTQGQQDRPGSRIAPPGQTPSPSSRPAPPNPVARPITPPPQAPRPMPQMQRSEPSRSMPASQPQRSSPAPAQRSSPGQR
ncbi:MAG: FecR protein [Edaphobacter sp.]|nr:FecR protein [Edaphobacter sp.]